MIIYSTAVPIAVLKQKKKYKKGMNRNNEKKVIKRPCKTWPGLGPCRT